MTLKDIAQEAGVSISTVSRVINKSSKSAASQKVQERIWEIVRRTGYTPNATARDLKNGTEKEEKSLPGLLPASLPGLPMAQQILFSLRLQEVLKKKHSATIIF